MYCFCFFGVAVTVSFAFLFLICAVTTLLVADLYWNDPLYVAVKFLAFLKYESAFIVAVTFPLFTLNFHGSAIVSNRQLFFSVFPFTLNTRFPPFTALPLVSVTWAINVIFSPITPFTGSTVTFVAFLPKVILSISSIMSVRLFSVEFFILV